MSLDFNAYNKYWDSIIDKYDTVLLDAFQLRDYCNISERDFSRKNKDGEELPFGFKNKEWRFSIDSVCRWLVAKGGEWHKH